MPAINLTKPNGWNEFSLTNEVGEAHESLIKLTSSLVLELDQIDKNNTFSVDSKFLKLETLKGESIS